MKSNKQISISIPEPCHQSWEQMTSVDNLHRHCASCDKVLTDFSGMSDTELVLWLKNSKGKMCGRYAPSQLNRAMTLPAEKTEKKKYWLNALWLIPFAWGSKEAHAQNTTPEVLRGKPPVSVITNTPQTVVVATAAKVHAPIQVTGTISLPDSTRKAAGAIVTAMVGGQNIQVVADSNGVYTITLPEDTLANISIWYSYSGYESLIEDINRENAVDGRIVRDVLFDRFEPLIAGIIIMDFDPKEVKPENVHPEKKSFWNKVRSGFSSGKGDKNEK